MKQSFAKILPTVLAAGFLANGCAAEPSSSPRQTQEKSDSIKKQHQETQHLDWDANMLKEIYTVKISDIATQRADVSHIVLKHIPLGTSKNHVIESFGKYFEITEQSGNKLAFHQKTGEGSQGSRRDVYITFFFDMKENLESVSAYIDKSNNL